MLVNVNSAGFVSFDQDPLAIRSQDPVPSDISHLRDDPGNFQGLFPEFIPARGQTPPEPYGPVTLTSASASKTYDGTALTDSSVTAEGRLPVSQSAPQSPAARQTPEAAPPRSIPIRSTTRTAMM